MKHFRSTAGGTGQRKYFGTATVLCYCILSNIFLGDSEGTP